jgi:hypothetical protein
MLIHQTIQKSLDLGFLQSIYEDEIENLQKDDIAPFARILLFMVFGEGVVVVTRILTAG